MVESLKYCSILFAAFSLISSIVTIKLMLALKTSVKNKDKEKYLKSKKSYILLTALTTVLFFLGMLFSNANQSFYIALVLATLRTFFTCGLFVIYSMILLKNLNKAIGE